MPRTFKMVCSLFITASVCAALIIASLQVKTAFENSTKPLGDALANAALPKMESTVKASLEQQFNDWLDNKLGTQITEALADQVAQKLEGAENALLSYVQSQAPSEDEINGMIDAAIQESVKDAINNIELTPNDIWGLIAAMAMNNDKKAAAD